MRLDLLTPAYVTLLVLALVVSAASDASAAAGSPSRSVKLDVESSGKRNEAEARQRLTVWISGRRVRIESSTAT